MRYGAVIMFNIPEPIDAGEIGSQVVALELQQRIVQVLAMHDIDVVIAGRQTQPLPFEANEDWWRSSVEAAREELH